VRAVGFNTDADAVVRSLEEDLGLRVGGRRVVVLGAGGAGRVAALRLAEEGPAVLHLVNRTREKAEAVAADIRERMPTVAVALGYPAEGEVDLVLNATSVGLDPGDGNPLDTRALSPGRVRAVYDMVYRPAETVLLREARAAGCRVANGLGMLLHQGAAALELWSGRPAPVGVMRRALETAIYGAVC
jgi:shikimate dehydrogenase